MELKSGTDVKNGTEKTKIEKRFQKFHFGSKYIYDFFLFSSVI